MNGVFMQILTILVLVGCLSSNKQSKVKNNDMNKTSNSILLSKNDLKDLVDIVSQNSISTEVKDSLSTLMFDIINSPETFDSIHSAFNYQRAPNMKNPNPTMDNWNAYEGDKNMWQIAMIDYLLYEFNCIGSIDGISGVMSTLQTSVHRNLINFDILEYDIEDFESAMNALNKQLEKSNRMIVTIDLSVFIIARKDFEKFKELTTKTIFDKVQTYD